MHISPLPPVPGQRILLAGRFGHQNFGDELIMLGNIKQLLLQHKTIYLLIGHHQRVRQRLSQHLSSDEIKHITLLSDIPRGVRSRYRYITQKVRYHQWRADTIILGGGEIITPETKTGYRYRRPYIRPTIFKKNLIIMGGIQPGHSRRQQLLLRLMLRRSYAIRPRDHEVIAQLTPLTQTPITRVMDTSRYAMDRARFRHTGPAHDTIILNINSKGLHHLSDIIQDIQTHISDTTHVYYVPVCAGPQDDDTRRYRLLIDRLSSAGLDISDRCSILDWREDMSTFLDTIASSQLVISPRLHLYLISQYLQVPTIVYPYQRKILKMQQELKRLGW